MTALLADAALQAGIRYETVVRPRIDRILAAYPDRRTTSDARWLLVQMPAEELLQWTHHVKLDRFVRLLDLCETQGIETVPQLAFWLEGAGAKTHLLDLNGIGPKTADYLGLLAGVPAFPIDRHMLRFLEFAGVRTRSYAYAQSLLFEACHTLDWDVRATEHSIWLWMAQVPQRGSSPRRPGATNLQLRERRAHVHLATVEVLPDREPAALEPLPNAAT
jgi:hypothetical protein